MYEQILENFIVQTDKNGKTLIPEFSLTNNMISITSYTETMVRTKEQLALMLLNNLKKCLEEREELKPFLQEVRNGCNSEVDYRLALYNIVTNQINKLGYKQFLGML